MGVSSHYVCSMIHSARLYAFWLVSLFQCAVVVNISSAAANIGISFNTNNFKIKTK